MLTKKQYNLLKYIDTQLKKTGVAPSFDEMKTHAGLKSKSGIHRLINSLIERGFLKKLPNKARALKVIKMPEINLTNKNIIYQRIPQESLAVYEEKNNYIPISGEINNKKVTYFDKNKDKKNFVNLSANFTTFELSNPKALRVKDNSLKNNNIIKKDILIFNMEKPAKKNILAIEDNNILETKNINKKIPVLKTLIREYN